MSKTTPNLAIPYPEGKDQPRGAVQMSQMALAIDNALGAAVLRATQDGGGTAGPIGSKEMRVNTGKGVINFGGWTYNASIMGWTVPLDGVYAAAVSVYWGNAGEFDRHAILSKNDQGADKGANLVWSALRGAQPSYSDFFALKKGDTVHAWVSADQTIQSSGVSIILNLARIGPATAPTSPVGYVGPPPAA